MNLRASILPALAAFCLSTAAVAPPVLAATRPLTRAEKIQQMKRFSVMSEGQQHIVRGWMAAHPGKKLPKAFRMIPVGKEEEGGRERGAVEAGGGLARAVQRAQLESSSTPHFSSFGANLRANNPAGDAFPDAGQSETAVVANGSNVLITWNDGDGFDRVSPNDQLLGYGYSTNGGTSWTDGGQLPQLPGHPLWEWSSDPVLVVNPTNGDVYFAGLVFPDGPPGVGTTNGLAVVKGTFSAGSFSWGTPTLVQSVSNGSAFIDKEWLAIDPASGNLYLTFTRFTLTGDEIDFTRSTNGGTVWSAPVALSSAADNGWVQGSRVAVGPSNEVYVTWMAIGHGVGIVQDFFRMRKSVTSGSSFAGEVTAASYYSNFGMGAPGFNRGRGITYPGLAVDRTNGTARGRVYLAWNECVNFYTDLDTYVPTGNISETEPSNTSGQNDNATRARQFTVGNILRGTIANRDTDLDFFKFSATQGQTYIFWADSTSDNLSMIFRLFCSDSTTRLAYSESGTGLGGLIVWTCPVSGQYYLRPAADPDPQFTPTIGPHPYRILTMAHVNPGSDRARDQRDIFVASSSNGTTWPVSGTGAPVRVNEDSPWFDNWLPEVAVTGDSHVFCTWFDFRDSNPTRCGGESNLYLYRSDNSGDSWTNLGLITDATTNWTNVATNVAPNQGDYIALFANGTNVIPCWGDGRDGNPNIYLVPILASTPTLASLASSRVEAGQVELDWLATEYANQNASLERNESGGGWSAVAEKVVSADGHVTFVDSSVLPGHTYGYRLAIAGSAGTVYSAETEIRVPAGYALALGPPQPNPAVRDLWIGFTLPTAEPASLTLVDIAGRVVATHEVGSLGAGPHRVNLAQGRQLPAGVYVVKLQQGNRTLTTRASVVR